MNTPHTTAIRQAAEEILGGLTTYAEAFQIDWPPNRESYRDALCDIISKHLAPLLENTRSGLVAACQDLIREREERDAALAKLAACEAEANGLRAQLVDVVNAGAEGRELLECIENGTDVHRPDVDLDGILITRELADRISAHLAGSKGDGHTLTRRDGGSDGEA